jgi:hypothetical protein
MFRLLVLTAGLVTFGNHAHAQPSIDFEKKTVRECGQIVLDAFKVATEAIAGLKDESTAPSVKKALQTAQSLVKQAPWMKDVMTGEEAKWVSDVFEPKKRQAEFELEKAQDKLLTSNPKLYNSIGDAKAFQEMKTAKIERAELQAQNLVKACKAYYISNDQVWPKKLLELAEPSNGSKPVLKGSKDAIIDPWGREYKLTIVKDDTGDKLPVISTNSPYGDGKQEIRWPKKDK